ncbi:MAG: hypothetical protein WBD52_04555 [Phycisphaerae bacterium]
MSLWLALLWAVACAAGFVVFILCRKWMADIGQEVREEVDHQIRRILKAAREAEEQLRGAFVDFRNPAAAVQEFQKARGEIEGVPRASPPWNWAEADLELLRRRSVADETARRCRPRVVGAIVGIVILAVCTGVVTVVLSNSVQPVLANPVTPSVATSHAGGSLPSPLNWPPPAPTPTPTSLPTLPQAPPPPADAAGNPPRASTQGTSSGIPFTQSGDLFQPPSDQGGQTQTTTDPSGAAGGSLPPQDNPLTSPQVPPAPAGSAGNTPAAAGQDATNGMTSAKAVTTNPSQPGEDP